MDNQLLLSIVCLNEEYRKVIYEELNRWGSKATLVDSFINLAGIYIEDLYPNDERFKGEIDDIYHDCERTIYISINVGIPFIKMWKLLVDQRWSHLVDNFFFEFQDYGYSLFETNRPDYAEMAYACVPGTSIDGTYYKKQLLFDELKSYLSLKGISSQEEDLYCLKKEFEYLEIPLEIIYYARFSIEDYI